MYSKNQKNKIYISYHTEFFVKMLKNQQVSNVLSDNDYTVIMLSKSYLFFYRNHHTKFESITRRIIMLKLTKRSNCDVRTDDCTSPNYKKASLVLI